MNGISFWTSTVKIKQIRDGTAHTYLGGEKYLNRDNYYNGLDDADDSPLFSGFDWDFFRWGNIAPVQDRAGVTNEFAFGSAHAASFNVVFCDGNVKSINYDIDAAAHSYLSDRQEGHAVEGSYY